MTDNRLLKLKTISNISDHSSPMTTSVGGARTLPSDIIIYEVMPHLIGTNNHKPLFQIGLTSKFFVFTAQKFCFPQLLLSAVNAESACDDPRADKTRLAVINYLKRDPEELFKEGAVTDHYGRNHQDCLYGILLGAGDMWAIKQIHKEIIPRIKDGTGKAKAAFLKRFPNYDKPLKPGVDEEARFYDERNEQQIAAIVKQLAVVKQCIVADPFTNNQPLDTTKQAIETLCKLFQPKPGEVIQSGLHFPLAIMKEIYKTYNALRSHLTFFTLAVIKPALDALSTVDGQCCQYGLNNLDIEKGPSRRCHSSYRHPLGQPLSLTLVNDKYKRGAAAVVDPYDGEVLFVSSTAYFNCYKKNGRHNVSNGWRTSRSFRLVVRGCSWQTYAKHKQRLIRAIMRQSEEKSNQHSVTMTN